MNASSVNHSATEKDRRMNIQNEYLQPRLVAIPKAAQLLGIGRTKTYELIGDGLLDTMNIGGRRLVTLRSIDRLIEQATTQGEAA